MKKLTKTGEVFKSNGRVFGKTAVRTHRSRVGVTDMAVADAKRFLCNVDTERAIDRLCVAIPQLQKLCRPLPRQTTLYELADSNSRRNRNGVPLKKKSSAGKQEAQSQRKKTTSSRRTQGGKSKLSNRKGLIVRTRARRSIFGAAAGRRRSK